jgi:hypothetical protein
MIRLGTLRCDITPPSGYPLCGGNNPPLKEVRDRLYGLGLLLDDGEKRLLLCSLEFTSLSGAPHEELRAALAAGAETTPDLVSVHCMHQHDAPRVSDEKLTGDANSSHREWWPRVVRGLQTAAERARGVLRPVHAVGMGEARVLHCASNRRLVGADGTVWETRWSRGNSAEVQAWPAGKIDPFLRTVTFWGEGDDDLLASMSYYNSHPQTADGRGIASADAPGEALRLLGERYPASHHVYFSGCVGDVTFGKYTTLDAEANIRVFGARLAEGAFRAIAQSRASRVAAIGFGWTTTQWLVPWRERPAADADAAGPDYGDFAQDRSARLALLELGGARVLHGMGELFVEYQLAAQALRPDEFVAFAGLGDPVHTYVPTAEAFAQGGYEVGVTRTTAEAEQRLKAAITRLLA